MSFWSNNKVLILGAVGAAVAVIQQLTMTEGNPDWKVIGFAVGVAIASYFAKNLTGQAASIAGILGTLIATIGTQAATGYISWLQIIIQALSAIVLIFTGPVAPAQKLDKK